MNPATNPAMKRHAPATLRNREPILDVLRPLLPDGTLVLEVASGTGEHAVFFGASLPGVIWQPSDRDPENLTSIEAHRAEAALTGVRNVRAPLTLDAAQEVWPVDQVGAVVCINMIHIAPWAACEGLIRGAARVIAPGGVLFLYGPYRIGGILSPESNVAFDASLRARDSAWGVRDFEAVRDLAAGQGFSPEARVAMPANNHSLVFRRA